MGYLYFLVMLAAEVNNFMLHFIGIAKMRVERFDVQEARKNCWCAEEEIEKHPCSW